VTTLSRVAAGALVVAAPALMTWGLLATLFDATLLDYFPRVSDELAYYQQIATFVRAGFDGGYFTNDEVPAPFALTHFGVHGPAFPVIYGLAGKVLGWTVHSGPIFNLIVLALATMVFIGLTRPSLGQIVAIGVVLVTSWWVILMASITMQESLNQAFMVVAAAFTVRLLKDDTQRRGRFLLGALVTIAVAAVLRPTNWIVAVPLVLVAFPRQPWTAVTGASAAGVGIPVFWLIWRFISAPIPDLAIEFDDATGAGAVARVWSYFVSQVSKNVVSIFDPEAFMERPFYQYAVFISAGTAAICALLVLVHARKVVKGARSWRGIVDLWETMPFRVDVLILIVLGTALVALFGFYFDSEASISRVMAPFLLLSQLVLLGTRRRPWLLASTIVASLVVAPSFLTTYRAWRTDLYQHDLARFQIFRQQVSPLLVFRTNDNAWCNTLLTMTYEREIVAVPAGIGLSLARVDASKIPVKSRYLLLTADVVERYRSRAALEPLGSTVLGELFLNRNAACG
jgi:hypothetical protein